MSRNNVIEAPNVSIAWLRRFRKIFHDKKKEFNPLLVSINISNPNELENLEFKTKLDDLLVCFPKKKGEKYDKTDTVAGTIFPQDLWNQNRPREVLFDRYLKILPKLMKIHDNRKGLYFQRLSAFGYDKMKPFRENKQGVTNQLDIIISNWTKEYERDKDGSTYYVHRDSMLQCTLFDPSKDHTTDPYLGFPCLQQVSFVPDKKKGTLTVNGFYAVQHIFNKAYGNYLGLCRLGNFVAHELGLTLTKMNCFIGTAKWEETKHDAEFSEFDAEVRKISGLLQEEDGKGQTAF